MMGIGRPLQGCVPRCVRLAAGLVLGIGLTASLPVLSQNKCSPPCDCHSVRGNGILGYEKRGNRCEGTIKEMVAGDLSLWIGAFTRGTLLVSKVETPTIDVCWPVQTGRLYVRAQPVAPGLFYRMDYIAEPPIDRFAWPTQVLSNLQPLKAPLGLSAWQIVDHEEVLVPVSQCGKKADDFFELVVVGSRALKLADLQVLDSLGKVVFAKKHERLYPKGTGVTFKIPATHASHLARIRVTVQWADSGSKSLEMPVQTL